MKTWIPWNPVEKKKILPNTLSLILNLEILYSRYWTYKKVIAKTIVITIIEVPLRFAEIRQCAIVTVTPLDKSTIVPNKGRPIGLAGIIPKGGQWLANAILIDKAESK